VWERSFASPRSLRTRILVGCSVALRWRQGTTLQQRGQPHPYEFQADAEAEGEECVGEILRFVALAQDSHPRRMLGCAKMPAGDGEINSPLQMG
jgi:hypothetical protein